MKFSTGTGTCTTVRYGGNCLEVNCLRCLGDECSIHRAVSCNPYFSLAVTNSSNIENTCDIIPCFKFHNLAKADGCWNHVTCSPHRESRNTIVQFDEIKSRLDTGAVIKTNAIGDSAGIKIIKLDAGKKRHRSFENKFIGGVDIDEP